MMGIFLNITEASSDRELEEFVLQALKRRMDKDDLILELCQKKKWQWLQSESFVKRIEKSNAFDLSIRWTRIFLVGGLIFFTAGFFTVVLLFNEAVGLNRFFNCLGYDLRHLSNSTASDAVSTNCMMTTLFGLADIFLSQTGILLIMLMAGGIGGMITAQIQFKKMMQSSEVEQSE